MQLTFNNAPVELKDFKGKTFTLRGFEIDDVLWFLLEEVVSVLQVNTEDVKELLAEYPEDFGALSDGRPVIKEGGFNYFALFVSETPEAKEYQDWVFNRVMPSIEQKGYYSIEEEVRT